MRKFMELIRNFALTHTNAGAFDYTKDINVHSQKESFKFVEEGRTYKFTWEIEEVR